MELFDKKYVHFMWEDELEGKEGFFSDTIYFLKEVVERNFKERYFHLLHTVNTVNTSCPFTDEHGTDWKFFYYDPNYEYKHAYAEGKQLQFFSKIDNAWNDCVGVPCWQKDIEYRIKPEEPKSRRMTYRELAEWLAKGNGEYRPNPTSGIAYTTSEYRYDCTANIIPEDYAIRHWNSDEWIEPTVDVYLADCKGE